MEQLVNFVIRPPRADYSPSHDLLEQEFVLKGHKYERKDLEVQNSRGHALQCSHYKPQRVPEDTSLPCVIYCHGNSGCRADANEAAIILLPSNITIFTLDFSGSGLSDGDYVSLGWNEMEDLKAVVSYLRTDKQVSRIGLWGRSMGAVTSLMYGAQDPSIAGMVLDSPFSNLFDLMLELVDVYKIRLPKFTVKVAVQYMRKVIQKKAQFDIMDLDAVKVADKCFIPALFGHATEDLFIQPHHSDLIFKAYAGDKNIIKFEGDHNSPRPQFYYDSITIFFFNVLRPPIDPVAEAAPDSLYFEGFELDDDFDESVLYEIMSSVHPSHPISGSSTSAPNDRKVPEFSAETTEEAINHSRSRWQMSKTVVPNNLSSQCDGVSDLARSDSLQTQSGDSTSCSHLEVPKHLSSPCDAILDVARNSTLQREIVGSTSCPQLKAKEYESYYNCTLPVANGAESIDDSWEGISPNGASDTSVQVSPCSTDDFALMLMEAIAASLKDLSIRETKDKETLDNSNTADNTATSRLESLSQRIKLGLFKGMGSRRSTR
ncbi:hypothetical protein O6H91_17G062500 [Diphasiastrum complanatum]|uniref:Uncharacterized protein n=1 Tax=Diphasiastrum complanatum TaxID=34168 RepID=A0ACC2B7H0_DIPCM|nr:hypothetical protein O6H91_17G062500 [Diphasiastrum complanatum]